MKSIASSSRLAASNNHHKRGNKIPSPTQKKSESDSDNDFVPERGNDRKGNKIQIKGTRRKSKEAPNVKGKGSKETLNMKRTRNKCTFVVDGEEAKSTKVRRRRNIRFVDAIQFVARWTLNRVKDIPTDMWTRASQNIIIENPFVLPRDKGYLAETSNESTLKKVVPVTNEKFIDDVQKETGIDIINADEKILQALAELDIEKELKTAFDQQGPSFYAEKLVDLVLDHIGWGGADPSCIQIRSVGRRVLSQHLWVIFLQEHYR